MGISLNKALKKNKGIKMSIIIDRPHIVLSLCDKAEEGKVLLSVNTCEIQQQNMVGYRSTINANITKDEAEAIICQLLTAFDFPAWEF